jgi:hypothetical protein
LSSPQLLREPVRDRRGLAAQPFIDNPDAAENALTQLIRQARETGQADAGSDARTEAISLLAMTATMGTGILVGQRTPKSATAALQYGDRPRGLRGTADGCTARAGSAAWRWPGPIHQSWYPGARLG